MLHIALIDDKNYGIQQIKDRHAGEECTLEYFETFRAFQESKKNFDITYLDFYLDKDGITGDSIISEVKLQSQKVFGFSSVQRCNTALEDLGADGSIVKI